MLTRFISGFSHRRLLSLTSLRNFCLPSQPSNHSHLPPFNPNYNFILESFRCFSSNRKDNGGGATKDSSTSTSWRFLPDNHNDEDSLFRDGEGSLAGIADGDAYCGVGSEKTTTVESQGNDESWSKDSTEKGDIFSEIDKEFGSKKSDGSDEWETAEGYRPWSFVDEDRDEVFDLGVVEALPRIGDEGLERKRSEADKQLEKEEQELLGTLKGPNRAFGDLIAASGITEAMLDSLMLLKDLENVEGLPPLTEIEDIRLEKNERKSTRAEIERQKQEEVAKARVRQVDEKGRAYGTGRRKCSIARVWIEPGDGKFIVNDKQFDVYFPLLDHRADLLRPFSETKTLGLWDVKCTVKGGGVSAGLLTRDPRVVERKKPGKAKARKSFQWVKR